MECEKDYKFSSQALDIIAHEVKELSKKIAIQRFNLECAWQNRWDDEDEEMPTVPEALADKWMDDGEFLMVCPHLITKDVYNVQKHYQENTSDDCFICPVLPSHSARSICFMVKPRAFMKYVRDFYSEGRIKELLESLNYYNIELD